MELQDVYQERLAAQMREWEAEIARLKARADIYRCDARIAYLRKMEALQSRLYSGRFTNNGTVNSETFAGIKEGFNQTLEKLRQSLGLKDSV